MFIISTSEKNINDTEMYWEVHGDLQEILKSLCTFVLCYTRGFFLLISELSSEFNLKSSKPTESSSLSKGLLISRNKIQIPGDKFLKQVAHSIIIPKNSWVYFSVV